MNVALDIDGTISEHPQFFAALSVALRAGGHRVLILTYRDAARTESTKAELSRWGIQFEKLLLARSMAEKGTLCEVHNVDVFFDDQDECITPVPERVLVFKVRNGGNFDFDRRKWVSTSRLTRLLE